MSVFKKLSAINVSKYTKEKMGLTYLPWHHAWAELQKVYPDSGYTFCETVLYSNGSCEVEVHVTVCGVTRAMILPVMDHKMKSIADPTSRDISDARMRCLVKCIAVFGLGLYLYSGEGAPEAEGEAIEDAVEEMVEQIRKDDIEFSVLWNEQSRDSQSKIWKLLNSSDKAVARELLDKAKKVNE